MQKPLADLLRPESLEEMVGQPHLLGKNSLFRKVIESGSVPNMIFYGPPGTGKTAAANIIAKKTNKSLYRLNGTTAITFLMSSVEAVVPFNRYKVLFALLAIILAAVVFPVPGGP